MTYQKNIEKRIANNTSCMFASFRSWKEHRLPEMPEFEGTSARVHLLRRMIEIEAIEGENITLLRCLRNDKTN